MSSVAQLPPDQPIATTSQISTPRWQQLLVTGDCVKVTLDTQCRSRKNRRPHGNSPREACVAVNGQLHDASTLDRVRVDSSTRLRHGGALVPVPGYAFSLETLKGADPPGLTSNPQAASLGAMGPDLFRFLPPSPTLAAALTPTGVFQASTGGQTNLSLVQGVLQDPSSFLSLSAAQQTAVKDLVPLMQEIWAKPVSTMYALILGPSGIDVATNWPLLTQVQNLLNTISTIVSAQNEIGLAEQIGNLKSLGSKTSGFSSIPTRLETVAKEFAFIIALGPWEEEPDFAALSDLPGAPSLPAQDDQAGCRLYELLRWHRAGDFASNLTLKAQTPAQKAFAEGWTCHYAAAVTGEPFVNNIVGGPYRTHWWRNMLVRNFVDAWIFGLVRTPATMANDTPTPAYGSWRSICSAKLHEDFNLAGSLGVPDPSVGVPAAVGALVTGNITGALPVLPAELVEISDLFQEALTATYSPAELALIGATSQPDVGVTFTPAALLPAAFVGAFAVYWFLTSGTGVFGNNTLVPPPSVACGSTPPPFVKSGATPSVGSIINPAGAACAVVMAILALLALFSGDLPGALAALAVAASAPVVNWNTLACDLWWITKGVLEGFNALRDGLVFAGLAYPPPILLGGADLDGNTVPATDLTLDPNLEQQAPAPTGNAPPTTGVPLTRSNAQLADKGYPAGLDTSVQGLADLDFLSFPTPSAPASVQTETPTTQDLIPRGEYANSVFTAPLANGGVLGAGGTYPSSLLQLGGSVANAKQALGGPLPLPNYNLDGDRGYGWLGWHPRAGSDPSTPPVSDEQDG
jgi:hypothetical protein